MTDRAFEPRFDAAGAPSDLSADRSWCVVRTRRNLVRDRGDGAGHHSHERQQGAEVELQGRTVR